MFLLLFQLWFRCCMGLDRNIAIGPPDLMCSTKDARPFPQGFDSSFPHWTSLEKRLPGAIRDEREGRP